MRVLLIHNRYQQYGGEDAVVERELRVLQKFGLSVVTYTRDNVELQELSLAGKALVPIQAIHSGRTVRDLGALILQTRPDVAYVHNLYPLISPSAYSVLERYRIPVVQVAHNFRPFCQNGLLHTRGAICERCLGGSIWPGIRKRCFRDSLALSGMYAAATLRARFHVPRLGAIIAMTEFASAKLQLAGIPAEQIFVRPNFIDNDAPKARPGTGSDALFLGRLSKEKGIWTLLNAAALVPQIQITLAGTGPEEAEIRRAVSDRALGNVRLTGFVSGEEKRRLIQNASLLVLPSESYENFPVVLLEAFRAAKPVVGSDLGGIPHIVRSGETGLLFPAGDHRALAACLLTLSGDPTLRAKLGAAAQLQAERDYTPERWFLRTMAIFQAVGVAPVGAEEVSV